MTDLLKVAKKYKEADYSKEATIVALMNNVSKEEIVKVLGFDRFKFDYATPKETWKDKEPQNCITLLINYNSTCYDSNGNLYRLHIRVFDIYRLYKRFVTTLVTKVFKPSLEELKTANREAISCIVDIQREISKSTSTYYRGRLRSAKSALKSNCDHLFNAYNYEPIDNIKAIRENFINDTL